MSVNSRTGKNSNKIKGDEFRDRIRDLCIAAGHAPLIELKISGKDVDLCFEIFRSPQIAKVAIEAKHYDKNLSKDTIDKIIGSYKKAIEDRQVDEVWVVASKDISTEARDTIKRNAGFFALSYVDFIKTLINFPRYVEHLKMSIENDGIAAYYVDQRFETEGKAVNHLLAWHTTSELKPVAVLSTYGMGKSSLAKMFAYNLADAWKRDSASRIPILIRLGELSAQQKIDGLLGSIFTNDVQVNGYSFPLFQKFNELGYLTIILDGLDEMRHAMTWADFTYNFNQIKQVIKPRTKCVMLGRPNTFQNEKEYKSVIEGYNYIGGIEIKSGTSMEFLRMNLAPFEGNEIDEFFRGYLRNFLKKDKNITDKMIDNRVQEIRSLGIDDLFSRPVHAKMMADIASDMSVSLKRFTRHGLYDFFINTVLERDYERHKGTGITPQERRRFLCDLAWHNWHNDKDTFRSTQIDVSLYSHLIDSMDPEGVLRELLSGSIIETKLGDVFYFSHRSLQEFMIAEKIIKDGARNGHILGSRGLTPEIASFISENPNREAQKSLFDAISVSNHYSVYTYDALSLTYDKLIAGNEIDIDDNATLWYWLFSAARKVRLEKYNTVSEFYKLYESLNKIPNVDKDALGPVFAHQLPCIYRNINPSAPISTTILPAFLKFCLSKLPFERFFAAPSPTMIVSDQDSSFARILARSTRIERDKNSEIFINTDIGTNWHMNGDYSRANITAIYTGFDQIKGIALSDLGLQSDPILAKVRKSIALANGNLRFVLKKDLGKNRSK